MQYEQTKGWEVQMWLHEQAEPHFQCLQEAGAVTQSSGDHSDGIYSAFHRTMYNV